MGGCVAARGQPPASLTPPTHPPNVHPTHPQVHAFTPLGERLPSAAFSLGAEAEGEGVAEAQVFRDGVAALTPGRRLWCARALGGGGGRGLHRVWARTGVLEGGQAGCV